ERRHEGPVFAADTVDRLEPDADTRAFRLAGDHSQALDDGVAVVARSGETDNAARTEWSETMNGRADCVDARPRVVWSFHQGKREDRWDRGDGSRRSQARR